jgi:hypothetical protein
VVREQTVGVLAGGCSLVDEERVRGMFRTKIGLIAAGLVVALVVVVYLMTVSPMAKEADTRVQNAVERASALVARVQRLKGFELQGLAESVARRKDFVDAVQVAGEDQRRVAVYDSITQYDKVLREEGRKAHFFGVTDKEGAIIARDLNPNDMVGDKLPYKNIREALAGRAARDIWSMKDRMMRAAAAPILVGKEVKGVVLIAYEVTSVDAREERDQFGTHVAYFMGDGVKPFVVKASSFSIANDDKTEDSGLAQAAMVSAAELAKEVLGKDKASEVVKIKIQNEEYYAIAGPMPVKLTNPNVGYLVASSIDIAERPVSRIRWMFLVLGLGMLILVLGGMWAVAKHFVSAEDKLELGVAEVINGNLEYTFDVVEEFEGLANALNVMLARMLGRPEPGEEGEGEDALWRADVIFVEELDQTASGSDAARQLAAEPEDAYYARVFHEYVEARRRNNLPVEGITQENLAQKLKANEGLLKAKHKCQMVRFLVIAQGGKVSLKPIRIG